MGRNDDEQSVETRGTLASIGNYVGGIVKSPFTYSTKSNKSKFDLRKEYSMFFSMPDKITVSMQQDIVEKLYELAENCLLSGYKEAPVPAARPVCGGVWSKSEEAADLSSPEVIDNETYGRPLFNDLAKLHEVIQQNEGEPVCDRKLLDEAVAIVKKHLGYRPYYGRNPSIVPPKDQDYIPYNIKFSDGIHHLMNSDSCVRSKLYVCERVDESGKTIRMPEDPQEFVDDVLCNFDIYTKLYNAGSNAADYQKPHKSLLARIMPLSF